MKLQRELFILVNIIFGIYLINYSLDFYPIPDTIADFNTWIILICGFLIIVGAINYWRVPKKHQMPLLPQ